MMNSYIWLENRYFLPEKDSGSDLNSLKGKCHSARTRDGKKVYIFKAGFENLPDEIKEAFKNLESLKEFQNKTWVHICRDRRVENLKRLLPPDILGLIAGYLDESTKVASACASQILKKCAGKTDFKNICVNAARDGHLEILKWAKSNGARWTDWTCTYAAENGYLELLKWANANGAPWNKWTCACAAGGGHLEVLKWARANGATWDEWMCAFGAREGHLELLKWARANGAPWDIDLIRSYANPEILEWLKTNP